MSDSEKYYIESNEGMREITEAKWSKQKNARIVVLQSISIINGSDIKTLADCFNIQLD